MNHSFDPQILPGLFPTVEHAFLFKSCAINFPVPNPEAIFQQYSAMRANGVAAETAYWSRLWPSAIGMCYFLEEHPELVKNKKILELGAGLGLPSLLAANHTLHVVCTDIHPNAIFWAKNAAIKNELDHIDHQVVDWNNIPAHIKNADTVLLSDGNYDPAAFSQLQNVIQDFLHNGVQIVLATPQRLASKSFVAALLSFCRKHETYDVVLDGQTTPISVLHFSANS
ncbi:class I SAM-dependent methyltransferase [Pseudocnuella soli]|uniref:class I SAM-dependent methyltransferase n=1 Tax=Pseudocnuella soli TaxID=2502779 RepID=UPI00104BFCAE|nr:methyltransferase domain-containing protein [Pseudocnuella soli]